jgi:hypothetical protein
MLSVKMPVACRRVKRGQKMKSISFLSINFLLLDNRLSARASVVLFDDLRHPACIAAPA